MRTGGGLLVGWADPADAFDRLAGASGDGVLLESTDGTGTSILGLGGRVLRALPEGPLRRDAAPGFEGGWIGWVTYEGEARFLEVEQALVFDHTRRTVHVLGDDQAWRREAAAAVADAGEPERPRHPA